MGGAGIVISVQGLKGRAEHTALRAMERNGYVVAYT